MPELEQLPKQKRTLCKVTVMGDSEVGKTQMINRYVRQAYSNTYTKTVGADFFTLDTHGPNGQPLTLQIWDLSGDYDSATPTLLRGSELVILTYALNKSRTLESVVNRFATFCEEHLDIVNKAQVLLVGNKLDLESECQIQPDMIDAAINQISTACGHKNIDSMVVSAKTGENIEEFDEYLVSPNNAENAPQLEAPEPELQKHAPLLKFPKTYGSLWHKQDDLEDKVFSLLNDYTKNNSRLKRLFTFHLLRHHTKAVHATLVELERGVIDTDDAVERLEALQPKANGSLHKRLMFIKMNSSAEESVDAPGTNINRL